MLPPKRRTRAYLTALAERSDQNLGAAAPLDGGQIGDPCGTSVSSRQGNRDRTELDRCVGVGVDFASSPAKDRLPDTTDPQDVGLTALKQVRQ